jgi:hypothetical protein
MMRPSLTWQTLAEVEREHVLSALRHTSGNWPSAARLLGVSLRRLRLRVKKYAAAGFQVSDFEAEGFSGVSTADDALRRNEHGDFESKSGPGSCASPVKQPTIDLPRSDTLRWVPSRKASVVFAVNNEMLSVEEACRRYKLTREELAKWKSQLDKYGLPGLRTVKAQLYRQSVSP